MRKYGCMISVVVNHTYIAYMLRQSAVSFDTSEKLKGNSSDSCLDL